MHHCSSTGDEGKSGTVAIFNPLTVSASLEVLASTAGMTLARHVRLHLQVSASGQLVRSTVRMDPLMALEFADAESCSGTGAHTHPY